eukprot:COSAG05_NODE_22159_length_266_cov_2.461078_1_plen_30_part_10
MHIQDGPDSTVHEPRSTLGSVLAGEELASL